jgi:hypothetical protein
MHINIYFKLILAVFIGGIHFVLFAASLSFLDRFDYFRDPCGPGGTVRVFISTFFLVSFLGIIILLAGY